MFRSWVRRVWGHAPVFTWSDLILGCSRKLVSLQPPAACATRAGGYSDPNYEILRPLPTPIPLTPGAMFTPVRGGRTGTSVLGVSSRVKCGVYLSVPRVATATLGAGAGGAPPL